MKRRYKRNARLCYAGVDLSLTRDVTAYCLCFAATEADPKYRCFWRYYLPRANIAKLEAETPGSSYQLWAEQGWLTLTEGDVVDYEYIRDDINADAERFFIKQVSIDPYRASQFTNDLMTDGFNVEYFKQGGATMGPATADVERLILDDKVAHDGNPITAWMMSNVQIVYDRTGNPLPTKSDGGTGQLGKVRYKIDGVIAMIMAVYSAATDPDKPRPSVYETRGVRIVRASEKDAEKGEPAHGRV